MWQSRARMRGFDIFGLIFWGIRVRLFECQENAHRRCIARGKHPTSQTGLRTAEQRGWRALGRSLLDIRLLTFSMGREDYRNRHVVAYAMTAQASLHLTVGSSDVAFKQSCAMQFGVAVLIEIQGIVRLLEGLLAAPAWVAGNSTGEPRRPVKITKYTLWLTCRTLLAHKAWRDYPMLVKHLPEILLGATFRGVPLQGNEFVEPPARGKKQALPPVHARDQDVVTARCVLVMLFVLCQSCLS